MTGGLQPMDTTLTTQQTPEVQTNPAIVEMPGGAPLTISGGRLVLANGETAPLSTDPASKLFNGDLFPFCLCV